MDMPRWKEFRFSNDGTFVAVGDGTSDVRVIESASRKTGIVSGASYDSGGVRLAIDPYNRRLFSGAYYRTGIGAYDFVTGERQWVRSDLKGVQHIAYDSVRDVVWCAFENRAARPLNAVNGREKKPVRGLKGFFFSGDSRIGVFELTKPVIEDRVSDARHPIPRESFAVLSVAFIGNCVVASWAGGPLVAYDSSSGAIRWKYSPEGTHVYKVAATQDAKAVWIAEQPFPNLRWHRLRRLSESGEIEREITCDLIRNFGIVPYHEDVIRDDLQFVNIESLPREPT